MIDISLNHAEQIMFPFAEDSAEHYQYDQELFALDFRVTEQALYAIRKWLLPLGFGPIGAYQVKEVCRYLLTKNKAFGGVWLPGIEGTDHSPEAMKTYNRECQAFHLLLWGELFPEEPYVAADLSQYRQRVDRGFECFPDHPQKWGTPAYRPW